MTKKQRISRAVVLKISWSSRERRIRVVMRLSKLSRSIAESWFSGNFVLFMTWLSPRLKIAVLPTAFLAESVF